MCLPHGDCIFLKPVNKNLSLISAWFRLVYVAILGAAWINLLNIILQVNGTSFSSIGEQLQTQVLLHLNAFYSIWAFGLIVFGIHALFPGWLIIKSNFTPKILGILLLLAFLGYFIINSSNLLFPQYKNVMKIVEYIF